MTKPFLPNEARTADVRALARDGLAFARSNDSNLPGAIIAAEDWSDDRSLTVLQRSATTPTTTSDAAAIVRINQSFLKSLEKVSAAAALLPLGQQRSFDRGVVSVQSLTMGEPVFVREGGAIPVKQGQTTGFTLPEYKLASISTMTSEMLSGSNVEANMEQEMRVKVGPALDKALFSAAPAVAYERPAGLLNGVDPLTPTAGGGADAFIGDVQKLIAALGPYAGSGSVVFIVAATQGAGTMRVPSFRYKLLESAALLPGTVIAIAVEALVSIVELTRFEKSTQVPLHMEDTSPADIGAVAAPVVSMWQTDSVGLRFITPCSWNLQAPGTIAWMQNVTW